MSESEKIAVGYEAGMMHTGAGGYYDNLVRQGMVDSLSNDPGKEGQVVSVTIGADPRRSNYTVEPKRVPPIEEAIGELCGEYERLCKVVEALTARLAPVLRPVPGDAVAVGAGGHAGPPVVSKVVASIRTQAHRLSEPRRKIEALIGRLDV